MKKLKNKLKNSNWLGTILFTIIGAICGYFGGQIIFRDLAESNGIGEVLLMCAWLLICLYITIFIQIAVHEGGHLIFGKLSGYQFVSYRISNLMFVKDTGKLKLKKLSIVGTGGQCLMMPPDCDGYQYPYILYNFGGSITNLLLSCLCCFYICQHHQQSIYPFC